MFSSVTTGKSQGDGAFNVELSYFDNMYRHQVQVEVSAAPLAGTLTVAVRSPEATDFVDLDGTFDLTGDDLLKIFGPIFAAEIRFTPAGFDAAKTYNVIVTSGVAG